MQKITICGSLKFKDQMIEVAEKLELEGNLVLCPIFPTRHNKDGYTEEEFEILGTCTKKE